jgi:peroxiredoxin family protein
MALPYDQITAITEKFFVPKFIDGVYGSNPFIARLSRPEQKEMFDGGERILAPVVSSKPTSGGYFTGYQELDTSPTDNLTSAEYLIKQLNEPIKISRLEELKNSGKAAKIKLTAAKMSIAEMNMKENLALGLFSDGTASTGALTTNQLTGLRLVMSTSATLGAIAVADMAEWIAVVDTNSGTNRALSLNLMQKNMGAATYDEKKPSVIVANQNIVDVYWGLVQPHQRLMSEEMSGLGFKSVLTFNGIPVIVDSHVEANAMYFVNEDFFKLYVHSAEDMRFERLSVIEGQAATLGRIFWAGNSVCNGRRYQSKIGDLLTS